MLLEEITNPTNDEQAGNLRNQKLDKQAMSLAGFLKKHPKLIPSVSKLLGVPLPVNKGLNTNKDGSVVYESLTESVVLSDLYGIPYDLLIEGRPEINSVILDFYSLEEGLLDNVKKVAKGAKAAGSGAVKATKATARAAKALSDKIDKAGKLLGETKPVADFSDKVDSLAYRYGKKLGEDSAVMKTIRQIGEIGNEHPKKTAFLIAVLTGTLSAFTGAAYAIPVGVALRTAVGMAKGEKFKVAFGKAAKLAGISALVGGVAGAAGEAVGAVAGEAIGWDGLEMQQIGNWIEGKYLKIKITIPGAENFEVIASGQQYKEVKMYQGNVARLMKMIENASPEDLHDRVMRARTTDPDFFGPIKDTENGAPVTQQNMDEVYKSMQSTLKEQTQRLLNSLKPVMAPEMQEMAAQKIKDAGELIDVGKQKAAVANALPAITKALSASLASGFAALKGAHQKVAKGGNNTGAERGDKNADKPRATYKMALGRINAFIQKLRPQDKKRLGASLANLLK